MSEQERQERGEMLRNAPAVEVAERQIVGTPELSARKTAEKWWDEHVSEAVLYNTEAGEVEINRNSVESSLAHRYGQSKLDAITSLVEGFENAIYLGSLPDSTRQEGTSNHYFAYPINYKGNRCYVFCRAMQDANKNRLYVQEVFVAENIKKGDTIQTAASQPHGGIALYKDILANVLEPSEPTNGRSSVSDNKDSETFVTGQETAEKVDGEDTRYRRGEDGVQGVRRTQESEMEREVRGFGERMADRLGGGVRLVYSDEIADSEAHAEEKRRSKGYYDTATGEVVVVLDNNTVKGVPSVIEVAMTMMHEVVGHKGVRGLFGTKEDAFLDDVYRGMKARTKAEMESLYGGQLRRREGESEEAFEARRRRLMADEYIARVAEEGNNPGLLRRVGAKVRGLLRGLGVELAITDNEIRDILRRSARELTRRKDGAMNVENDIRYRDSTRKEYQLEVINRYNPMLDDVHAGIRSVKDIQSFEEIYEQAKKGYEEYGDMVYPDMDMNMLENALETGYIRVYSSNRISPGVFVTPSRMNAEDYSGGRDVYSEIVSVNDVAWIDQSEGQYTGGEIRYRKGIKNPPEENTQPLGTIASQSMDVAKVRKEEEKRQTAKKNL